MTTVFDHSYWWPWGAFMLTFTVGAFTIGIWTIEWLTGWIARRKRSKGKLQ